MENRWIPAVAALAVGAAAVALFWFRPPASADGHRPADTGATQAQAERAATGIPAFVTDLGSWRQNGENGRYYAPLIAGATPQRATVGTVRTDTDCTPDAQGLSHCHNVIELPSGRTVTVQDNHDMRVNRCLSPGEAVTVMPIGPGWVELHTRPG